ARPPRDPAGRGELPGVQPRPDRPGRTGRRGRLVRPLSFDVLRPGITVTNGRSAAVLYLDLPHTALIVRRDTAAYLADHGLGVLMVHYHNRVGSKAQGVHLKVAATASLRRAARRV